MSRREKERKSLETPPTRVEEGDRIACRDIVTLVIRIRRHLRGVFWIRWSLVVFSAVGIHISPKQLIGEMMSRQQLFGHDGGPASMRKLHKRCSLVFESQQSPAWRPSPRQSRSVRGYRKKNILAKSLQPEMRHCWHDARRPIELDGLDRQHAGAEVGCQALRHVRWLRHAWMLQTRRLLHR